MRMLGIGLVYVGMVAIVTGWFVIVLVERSKAVPVEPQAALDFSMMQQAITEEQTARHQWTSGNLALQQADNLVLQKQIDLLTGQTQAVAGNAQKLTEIEHRMTDQDAALAQFKTLIEPLAKAYLESKMQAPAHPPWSNMDASRPK